MTNLLHSRPMRPVDWFVSRVGWLLCACVQVLAASGCSPELNWRDVRPKGSTLQVLMPCKPESAQRDVALPGGNAVLNMLSCDAGGLTFAVSALSRPPAMTSQDVIQAWHQASQISLSVAPGQTRDWVPAALFTAQVDHFSGWQAQGHRHDGTLVQAHAVLFARGTEVFQAAVYGAAQPEVLATFLDGLRLDPTR